MASIKNNFLTGILGPAILYEYRGKQVARARPKRVKQTKATKASAKSFGLAVNYSRLIRSGLWRLHEYFTDYQLMYRMNAALIQWLKKIKKEPGSESCIVEELVGMETNEQVPSNRRLKLKTVVDFSQTSTIMIHLPAMKPAVAINAPPGTNRIRLGLVAIRCNTDPGRDHLPEPLPEYFTQVEFDYDHQLVAEQTVEIPFQTLPGDILLIAMGIHYFKPSKQDDGKILDSKWVTGRIIGVKYCE